MHVVLLLVALSLPVEGEVHVIRDSILISPFRFRYDPAPALNLPHFSNEWISFQAGIIGEPKLFKSESQNIHFLSSEVLSSSSA